ncbi:MAG: hypothetical protein LBK99_07985 [Opitutaceae bacterium]|jgi:hypothetical protein|nr:hypothetical protein [Opitutaceae bacterium]
MSNTNYIPRPDDKFDIWQKKLVSDFTENFARYGISQAALTALETIQTRWGAAWNVAQHPETRSQVDVEAKNRNRKEYEKALREMISEHITYNRTGVTDDDRVRMGLPVHKTTHTPVPVPTAPPATTWTPTSSANSPSGSLSLAANAAVPNPSAYTESRYSGPSSTPPPGKLSDLTHSSFDTNSPLTLLFDEDQRGKTLYYCLRWENTRGEKGPASEIFSAIIP